MFDRLFDQTVERVLRVAIQINPPNGLFVDPDSVVHRLRALHARSKPSAVMDRVLADTVRRTLVTILNDEQVRVELDRVIQATTRATLLALAGETKES